MSSSSKLPPWSWLGWQTPIGPPALIGLVGFVSLVLAIALTIWVWAEKAPIAGDVDIMQAIQEPRFAIADGYARFINFLGTSFQWIPYLIVLIILVRGSTQPGHRRPKMTAALVTLAVAAGLRFVNPVLKELVESPRPTEDYGVIVDSIRQSYGFPSGHTFGDVLLFGAMGVHAAAIVPGRWSRVLQAAVVMVILSCGWARVYIGAHWPSDVAGGYLWGFACLAIAILVGAWAGHTARRATTSRTDL